MDESFRVRIKTVRFKDLGGNLVVFPNADIERDDDTKAFIYTLTWLLDKARRGEVKGYCGAAIIRDDKTGGYQSMEFGTCDYPGDKLELVGLLEGSKMRILSEIVEDMRYLSGPSQPV